MNAAAIPESDILESIPYFPLKLWQIECPAMIFVYLPNDEQKQYHFVKLLSHFFFGVSSQCVVQGKYSDQFQKGRNADQ
jgi:hypothetical protein